MNKNDLIYGIHTVQTALTQTPQSILEIWLDLDRRDKRIAEIQHLAAKAGLSVHDVSREQLDHLLPGVKHQGVIAHCKMPGVLTENDLYAMTDDPNKPPLLLILDGVQDPHNLGACLRSADGAGVDAVIIPKDKSVGLTPAVAKVASGALHNVPVVQVTNLARTMEQLKKAGIWLVGMDDKGEQTLYQIDLTVPVAIAMGAEGAGLRRLSKEKCDFLVKLPMAGVVESLNVSVASGICLYEAMRQRNFA
jgi:23S rRNA (guanosine2251-2'-O)-methyltransferase